MLNLVVFLEFLTCKHACTVRLKDSAEAKVQHPLHNVQFVKYDVTVSFMAQVLDTVTYLVPQVLDTAS